MKLGPNGGLVFCIEYLSQNMEWLEDELSQFDEDGYFLFDCPGTCWLLEMKGRPDRTLLPLFLPGGHYKSTHRIWLPSHFRLSGHFVKRVFIVDGLPFHLGRVQVHIGELDGVVVDAAAWPPSPECALLGSSFPVDPHKVRSANAGHGGQVISMEAAHE